MIGETLLKIFILITVTCYSTKSNYLDHNVNCEPHLDVISTDDSNTYQYIPYFVKLHRCQGKDIIDNNPFSRVCIPVRQVAIKYTVEKLYIGVIMNITLYNHTDCAYVCKFNRSSCPNGAGWNEELCSCCDRIGECEGDYEWDNTHCRCTCPESSKNRCGEGLDTPIPTVPTSMVTGNDPNISRIIERIKSGCINNELVILIAVVELVIIICISILVFYFAFYRRHEGMYAVEARNKKIARVKEPNDVAVINNEEVGGSRNGLENTNSKGINNDDVGLSKNNSKRNKNDVPVIHQEENHPPKIFVITNDIP